jgi:hypothetical protein
MQEPTTEIFRPNAWYGFARQIKKYAKWPLPLPIVVPHGVELSKQYLWMNEIENELPAIWAFPKNRYKIYKKYGKDKKVLNGCSPWLFLLTSKQQILGRSGTVALPAHSTHHVTANFNDQRYADYLKRNINKENPVTVCMFWRDIELGRDKNYLEKGLPVISAGHMFDENFADNLFKIFRSFEYMHTNEIGNHLYYAASTGCKVILKKNQKIKYKANKEILKRDVSNALLYSQERKITNIFSSREFRLQKKLSLQLLGNQNKPTPFEMFIILFKISLTQNFIFKKAIPHFFAKRSSLI